MGLITYTKPSDGEAADAADITGPLDTIYNEFNGKIDGNNIASTAALSVATVATTVAIFTDTISEKTSAAGVTIDSLKIKDGKLATNDSVVTTNITDANVTPAKLKLGSCSYNAGAVNPAQTTTSATYVDITNASASITTTGGALLLSMGAFLTVDTRVATLGLQINGVDYDIASSGQTTAKGTTFGTRVIAAGVVPAGTYTVKGRFHVQTGGDTASLLSYHIISFSVVEF